MPETKEVVDAFFDTSEVRDPLAEIEELAGAPSITVEVREPLVLSVLRSNAFFCIAEAREPLEEIWPAIVDAWATELVRLPLPTIRELASAPF